MKLTSSPSCRERLPAVKVAPGIPYVTIGFGLLVFHNAWLAILGYHAGIAAVILLSKARASLKEIFRVNRPWLPVIAVLAGAAGGMLPYLLWPLLSAPNDIGLYIQSIGLNERTWLAFLAYFVIINPFLEELLWRGCLSSSAKGLTLNDCLYSGYHMLVLAGHIESIWLIAVFCVITIGAWFWRQINRLNGGLLPSIVSHVAVDMTVITTIYLLSE